MCLNSHVTHLIGLGSYGVVKFMNTLGYLTVASSLFAIPAWILGKDARNWYGKASFARFTSGVASY